VRKGRDLELLVAQLEHILGEGTFEVKSPEYIPNRHTGDQVEVDVTLRGRAGSSDVLVALECRDRNKPGDVNWIRELHSKQDDIGANAIVAVARAGFTKDARAEAAAKGVQLRSFAALSAADVADVLLGIRLTAHPPRFRVTAIEKLSYRPFSGDWPPIPPKMPDFSTEKFWDLVARPDDKDILDEKEQQRISFKEMVLTADWRTPFEGLPLDETRTIRNPLPCQFTDSYGRTDAERFRWFFSPLDGIVFTELVVVAEVFFETETVELSRTLEYSDQEQRLARVAEFDVSPYGWPAERLRILMITRTPQKGR
jgi:Restriction endonuclease